MTAPPVSASSSADIVLNQYSMKWSRFCVCTRTVQGKLGPLRPSGGGTTGVCTRQYTTGKVKKRKLLDHALSAAFSFWAIELQREDTRM